jgi:hypothetical protein
MGSGVQDGEAIHVSPSEFVGAERALDRVLASALRPHFAQSR